MTKFKSIFLVILAIGLTQLAIAQNTNVEMAGVLRSNGKIYAVVAVCLTILIGLFIYLFTIDRKLRKLEKGDL